MRYGHGRGRLFFLVAFLVTILLTMSGCGDDDDFESVEPDQLENKSFVFPAGEGEAFGIAGRLVLDVESFGFQGSSNVAPVTLTTPGGVATGTIRVDEDDIISGGIDLSPESECDVFITTSTIGVLPAGIFFHFRPCDIDDETGALRVVNDDTGEESVSNRPTDLSN